MKKTIRLFLITATTLIGLLLIEDMFQKQAKENPSNEHYAQRRPGEPINVDLSR